MEGDDGGFKLRSKSKLLFIVQRKERKNETEWELCSRRKEEVSLIRGVANYFAVSLAVTCRIVFLFLYHAPLFCRIFIFFNFLVIRI